MGMLHLYMNGTEGKQDGTAISEDRTFLASLSVELNAGNNQTKIVPVAIRTDAGKAVSMATITTDIYDDTAKAWTGNADGMIGFSETADGSDAAPEIALTNITENNKIFYVVFSSSSLQSPGVNKNSSIKVNYEAESV